jgi:putative selenoprotein
MSSTPAAIAVSKATARARRAWLWLRQVSGDAAYENYLRCAGRRTLPAEHSAARLLSPVEFYLDALRRRYSSVSRCC